MDGNGAWVRVRLEPGRDAIKNVTESACRENSKTFSALYSDIEDSFHDYGHLSGALSSGSSGVFHTVVVNVPCLLNRVGHANGRVSFSSQGSCEAENGRRGGGPFSGVARGALAASANDEGV